MLQRQRPHDASKQQQATTRRQQQQRPQVRQGQGRAFQMRTLGDTGTLTPNVNENPVCTQCLIFSRLIQLNYVGGICIFIGMCLVLVQNIVETLRIQQCRVQQCQATVKAPPRLILICRLIFLLVSLFGGVCMAKFAKGNIQNQRISFVAFDNAFVIIFWINSGVAIVNSASLLLFLINYHSALTPSDI